MRRRVTPLRLFLLGSQLVSLLHQTTDLDLAKRPTEDLVPPDRTTDLDGALALAASLVKRMPQPQQRVVGASEWSRDRGCGATSTTEAVSRWVALVLLGLVVVELVT